MIFNMNVNVRHHNEDILKFFTSNFEVNNLLTAVVIESVALHILISLQRACLGDVPSAVSLDLHTSILSHITDSY